MGSLKLLKLERPDETKKKTTEIKSKLKMKKKSKSKSKSKSKGVFKTKEGLKHKKMKTEVENLMKDDVMEEYFGYTDFKNQFSMPSNLSK